ncbi:hypothetical protein [Streptomyces sp. NPDC007172]|uniref:hypothetical protein n=1 Tax=Streptomyces sp. NPDC007172 TaxID=3364776 RepID=UPI0036A8EEC7
MNRRLSAQLAQARRDGTFPDLIDTVRQVHVPPAWASATEFIEEMPEQFRLDRTRGQREALYVAVEKDTLRALVELWLGALGIPVVVVRGFSSESYVQVIRTRVAADPRPARLFYVGDFDASGHEIERDWIARTACWAQAERVALTAGQVQAYDLPATTGKAGDSRWPRFAAEFALDVTRPVQWEVEALPPSELQRLVVEAVRPHIDRGQLQAVLDQESEQRRALLSLLRPGDGPESKERGTR